MFKLLFSVDTSTGVQVPFIPSKVQFTNWKPIFNPSTKDVTITTPPARSRPRLNLDLISNCPIFFDALNLFIASKTYFKMPNT